MWSLKQNHYIQNDPAKLHQIAMGNHPHWLNICASDKKAKDQKEKIRPANNQ